MKSIIINRVVILVGFYDVLQLKKPHTQMIPTILPYNGYRTCLNNHMGSILCYITPLIINNLGGGHTHTKHTHTHSRMHTDVRTKAILKNQEIHLV